MNDLEATIAKITCGDIRIGAPLIEEESGQFNEELWIDAITGIAEEVVENNKAHISSDCGFEELPFALLEYWFRNSFPYDDLLIEIMGSTYFDGRIDGGDI